MQVAAPARLLHRRHVGPAWRADHGKQRLQGGGGPAGCWVGASRCAVAPRGRACTDPRRLPRSRRLLTSGAGRKSQGPPAARCGSSRCRALPQSSPRPPASWAGRGWQRAGPPAGRAAQRSRPAGQAARWPPSRPTAAQAGGAAGAHGRAGLRTSCAPAAAKHKPAGLQHGRRAQTQGRGPCLQVGRGCRADVRDALQQLSEDAAQAPHVDGGGVAATGHDHLGSAAGRRRQERARGERAGRRGERRAGGSDQCGASEVWRTVWCVGDSRAPRLLQGCRPSGLGHRHEGSRGRRRGAPVAGGGDDARQRRLKPGLAAALAAAWLCLDVQILGLGREAGEEEAEEGGRWWRQRTACMQACACLPLCETKTNITRGTPTTATTTAPAPIHAPTRAYTRPHTHTHTRAPASPRSLPGSCRRRAAASGAAPPAPACPPGRERSAPPSGSPQAWPTGRCQSLQSAGERGGGRGRWGQTGVLCRTFLCG